MAAANDQRVYRASSTAPVNIAVIKYWGKRDATLNLPTNSSLSVTLSQSSLRAYTTASCSAKYPPADGDSLTLNNKPHSIQGSPRTLACLADLRSLRQLIESSDPSLPKLSTYPLRIVSENNFPTAAGLASSAAGFAALVRAVADLYQLPQSASELSKIARKGSGSACRSLMGGYPLARDASSYSGGQWCHRKEVPSSECMQLTVATSTLFPSRAQSIVPERMTAIEKSIQERNFETFAEITMRDSNGFHATNLDTWPPTFYLNDTSRAAIRAVHDLNRAAGRSVCAYTFDAGPNAVIYYLEKDADCVLGAFKSILTSATEGWESANIKNTNSLEQSIDPRAAELLSKGVGRVFLTGVGGGPISKKEHLVSESGEILTTAA
ncbi:diphosphomevalonate decarboxylase [Trichophyton tonsurans CBS 112818]|uniref:Diphosphomevalonate decarboxylase n=1 Tax=Trichophyton tonsurans (strain CBS 112818) TaxID=647933 RepID=F2RRG7_TRIT1|nr:diphosphomevalonate decarboxylase [Trichophyton tonsurans CBS 112818]